MIKRRIVTVVSDRELSIMESGGSYYIVTISLYRPSAVRVNASFSEVLFVIPHSLEIIHPKIYWVFRG